MKGSERIFLQLEWVESIEWSDGIISITDQSQRAENATAAGFYLSSGIGCKIWPNHQITPGEGEKGLFIYCL